jgi:hypothetical protein
MYCIRIQGSESAVIIKTVSYMLDLRFQYDPFGVVKKDEWLSRKFPIGAETLVSIRDTINSAFDWNLLVVLIKKAFAISEFMTCPRKVR